MANTTDPVELLQVGDALVIVDVQNDFCPGGALPIPAGDAIVPVLNRWLAAAAAARIPVFASRDWHPRDHISFRDRGGPWPAHCVQGTPGAELRGDLALPPDVVVLDKGTQSNRDAYSAFAGTGLGDRLRERGVRRVWIGGLAEDVCVAATVLEARSQAFAVRVIAAATRPTSEAAGEEARAAMTAAGATLQEDA